MNETPSSPSKTSKPTSLSQSPTFVLDNIEPVTYQGQHYGKSVEFNVSKAHCKFYSQFHAPDYLSFAQIEHITIRNDHKRKLLIWGLATILLFVGILILLVRVRVPNWKIQLKLKKIKKPVTIMAWLDEAESTRLANFLNLHSDLVVHFIPRN
ncbi:MAG: hypothetical protein E4G98_05900 [Promethearchaeota archaeon]|nr:MAG: hypothetical protein E4G98_05900 [Candidatus Lokiarchaeota archaeon]